MLKPISIIMIFRIFNFRIKLRSFYCVARNNLYKTMGIKELYVGELNG